MTHGTSKPATPIMHLRSRAYSPPQPLCGRRPSWWGRPALTDCDEDVTCERCKRRRREVLEARQLWLASLAHGDD